MRLGNTWLNLQSPFQKGNTISGPRHGTNHISNVCVHTHAHTHEHEYRLYRASKPDNFRGQTTEESSVKYLTYTTTVS